MQLEVKNVTSLLKKELLLYSFFEIQFQRPIKLLMFGYIFLWLAIWAAPLIFFFVSIDAVGPYSMMFSIGPPIGLGILMSKPIWDGKSFGDWFKTHIKYISNTKEYIDLYPPAKNNVFYIDTKILVSRRRDYYTLSQLIKEEKESRRKLKNVS